MKTKYLASYLCLQEGGKSQGKIHDKRQDISALSDLIFKECRPIRNLKTRELIAIKGDTVFALWKNGQRRHARRNARKRRK